MSKRTASIVNVGLGARAYDIHIGAGLLQQAGAMMAPLLKRNKTVIVSDETVFAAQGPRLVQGLAAADISHDAIILKPGEATKNFTDLQNLLSRLLDLGVDRGDLIIAFGGGVIGDLAGFAAAVLRRGCRFVQIPTTLLAQVDSAVGGKTGINMAQGKNLIGAFHQPSLVLADSDALTTLPMRELRAGYGEIVKYGALGDAAFFAWLEENSAALIEGDNTARIYAVEKSCTMKAAIVADDEREAGKRALLNLGHTFAHALEASCGYSGALLHGEAVAAGLGLAFDYSVACGFCPAGDAQRLKAHLAGAGLPTGLKDIRLKDIAGAAPFNADELLGLMMQDKKVEAGSLTLVLARKLGEAFIERGADQERLGAFLKEKAGS